MRISVSMCMVLTGILMARSPAIADTVSYGTLSATLHSEHSFAEVDINLNGGGWTRALAGVIDWQRTGGSYTGLGGQDNSGFKFYTFCDELTQDVYFGGSYTYTVVDLQDSSGPAVQGRIIWRSPWITAPGGNIRGFGRP